MIDSGAFELFSKKKLSMANQTSTSKFIKNRYGKKNKITEDNIIVPRLSRASFKEKCPDIHPTHK